MPTTSDADDVSRLALSEQAERVLSRTGVERWPFLGLLHDPETGVCSAMSRGDLVAWCRANDLHELARDVASRRVPRRAIVALVVGPEGPRVSVFADELDPRSKRR